MRFIDLLLLIFDNLGRRKARVALTAVGVVIGTAAVVVLVSLAIGLQRNANQQLYGIGDLTQIQVMPPYGGEGGKPMMMGGGGGGVVTASSGPDATLKLTNATLDEFRALPGVAAVIPREYLMASMMMKYQRLEAGAGVMGIAVEDLSILGLEAIQGQTSIEQGAAII